MKKFIGIAGSWTTYFIGDIFSKIAYSGLGKKTSFFYKVYNTFMAWSINIQDWGGKGPWEKVDKPGK